MDIKRGRGPHVHMIAHNCAVVLKYILLPDLCKPSLLVILPCPKDVRLHAMRSKSPSGDSENCCRAFFKISNDVQTAVDETFWLDDGMTATQVHAI